jgi:uncharacterized protein YcbK (DUF882 family)
MKYWLILPLLFYFRTAGAQGLGPVVDTGLELRSDTLLDQLASIPDYATSYPLPTPGPDVTEQEVQDVEESEGGDIFISTETVEPPMPVNLGGNGKLTITRRDTGEKINLNYRTKDGGYDMDEIARFDHITRCSLNGEEADMSIKLAELLDAVEDHFGKRGLVLLSGYRTLALNRTLPGAAEHSLHMLGWAADIRVPGYTASAVKKYALRLGAGGVGYYPSKGFTHIDVGRVRYWMVRAPVRRRRRKIRHAPPARAVARRQVRHPAAAKAAPARKKAAPARKAGAKTAFVKKKTV